MNGLTLSRDYYTAFGPQLLSLAESLRPGLSRRLSIGLSGEGSQCLGFDDGISRDHDFAPGFCVWMSDADFTEYGSALQACYSSLPGEFKGLSRQNILAPDRLGVMSVSGFFNSLTGIPEADSDWLFLSESALASAVSGEIWLHGCSEFESVRNRLLAFYPDDILRKKLAARAAVMSQAGQYNLLRMMNRNDQMASMLAAARFAEASISLVHLLAKKYTPFYKWAYRSLHELAKENALAELTSGELEKLPEVCILPGKEGTEKAFAITEKICTASAAELRRQGYSQCRSNFLQDHLDEIMQGIQDPSIRSMHPMVDPAF